MKQRMRNGKFMAVWIPICSLFVVIVVGFTVAAGLFGGVFDTSLGRGKRHVIKPEHTETWDTDYYEQKYSTLEDAKKASQDKMREVVSEGMVLLKNDGTLPLAQKSAVTPFGRGYAHPIFNGMQEGGSIKYTPEGVGVSPETALKENFTIIDAAAKKQPAELGLRLAFWTSDASGWFQPSEYPNYPDSPGYAEGTSRHDKIKFGADSQIPELAASVYADISDENSEKMRNSTALVFVTRSGGEDGDKKCDAYTDGTPHYLALSKNERDMIAYAKEKCGKVVLVVNSSNPLELLPVMQGELEVNAIVWAGHPGDVGFYALSDILCGKVNPSGRTVDLFATNFLKTPSFNNWGSFTYDNATRNGSNRFYVEYAEGMYNGYRYYETAHDISAAGFTYGTLDGHGACTTAGEVAYPFGYGLSYTDFEWEILTLKEDGNDFEMTVKVSNTGDKAGKDVVQLYMNAPYTQLDRDMKIEKPTANLIAFAKTKLIDPGRSDTVKLTFAKDELASYCYTRDNGDGTFGCYMLEEGAYEFTLRRNSHDIVTVREWRNPRTVWYDASDPRPAEKKMQSAMAEDGSLLAYPESKLVDPSADYIAATNLFGYMNDYMSEESTLLTRSNWATTLPFGEKVTHKSIAQKYVDMFGIEDTFDYATDAKLGNVEGSYVYRKMRRLKKPITVCPCSICAVNFIPTMIGRRCSTSSIITAITPI